MENRFKSSGLDEAIFVPILRVSYVMTRSARTLINISDADRATALYFDLMYISNFELIVGSILLFRSWTSYKY